MITLLDTTTDLGAQLKCDLARVDAVIAGQLRGGLGPVDELCGELSRYRGKMLRPTLVLLAASASSPDCETTDRVDLAAAVVELIHMATLAHDDVLDEADLRRGGPTINRLHGNEAAVMLGDWLISNAFHLCSRIGSPDLNLFLGETTNTLCAGEILQLHYRDDLSIDRATYFMIIRKKTASLVAACCQIGAMLADAPRGTIGALSRFGLHLGMAFQIRDDLIDLVCDAAFAGKPVGADVRSGKMTLATIMLREQDPEVDVAAGDPRTLREALDASGALDAAWAEMEMLTTSAVAELELLPASAAKTHLLDLASGLRGPLEPAGGQSPDHR